MNVIKPAREADKSTIRRKILAGISAANPHALYAIIDAAIVSGLPGLLAESGERFDSLFPGTISPDIAEVSPYFAVVSNGSLLLERIAEQWDAPWGLFAVSSEGYTALLRHFRKLFVVHGSDGKPMLFRFWDRRVLPGFLDASTAEERQELTGPITALLMTVSETHAVEEITVARGQVQSRDLNGGDA